MGVWVGVEVNSEIETLTQPFNWAAVVQGSVYISRLKIRFFFPKHLPTISRNIFLEFKSSFDLFRENYYK